MKKITLIAFILMCIGNVYSQNNMKPVEDNDQNGAIVELSTTLGDITLKLYDDTPLHKENFLKLVDEGFYDGLLFHRVINDFMIQGGDPTSRNAGPDAHLGAGDPDYTIPAEIVYPRHYHKYGALAAARTGDAVNPERRSSGSQFYIVKGRTYTEKQIEAMHERKVRSKLENTFQRLAMEHRDSIESMRTAGDLDGLEALRQKLVAQTEEIVKPEPLPEQMLTDYATVGGTPHLDGEYTVFGEVISGMEVVEAIEKVETDENDRPKEDVKIVKARVVKK